MKKGTIILLCIGGALLLLIGFGISKYNGLVEVKTIFWHRFIFKQQKNIFKKIWVTLSFGYVCVFTLLIALLKLRFDILKVKVAAIKDAVSFLRCSEYKNLPKICFPK